MMQSLTRPFTFKWALLVKHSSLWPDQGAGPLLNALVSCFALPSLQHNWFVFLFVIVLNLFLLLLCAWLPYIVLIVLPVQIRLPLSLLCMHTGALPGSMALGGDGQEWSGFTASLPTSLSMSSSSSSDLDCPARPGTTCFKTRWLIILITPYNLYAPSVNVI